MSAGSGMLRVSQRSPWGIYRARPDIRCGKALVLLCSTFSSDADNIASVLKEGADGANWVLEGLHEG
jgi:hypothetical protein